MNILFLAIGGLESFPQSSIYTDLLIEFSRRGHNVHVASAREKRSQLPTVLEEINGVKLLKVKVGNITEVNRLEKGFATLMIERQYLRAIKQHYADVKFDLIMYSTPPITFYEVVKFIKQRDQAVSYLLLKDIFPQNAVDLEMFSKSSLIYKYFRNKEKKLYALSDYIGTMSEANTQFLLEHNPDINPAKVGLSPNTIYPHDHSITEEEKQHIRAKYNIPHNKKVFLYGGNLGRPQGIDFLMECLLLNESNEDSYFLIVGSGTEFAKLKRFFDERQLQNAKLISYLPKADYDLLANSADIGLIFLDYRFTIPNFPSRLLSYMQAKMPVLSATDPSTDVGDMIEQGEFGRACLSNDSRRFNVLVNELAQNADLKQMGQNAWNYLLANYTSERSYNLIMSQIKQENTNRKV